MTISKEDLELKLEYSIGVNIKQLDAMQWILSNLKPTKKDNIYQIDLIDLEGGNDFLRRWGIGSLTTLCYRVEYCLSILKGSYKSTLPLTLNEKHQLNEVAKVIVSNDLSKPKIDAFKNISQKISNIVYLRVLEELIKELNIFSEIKDFEELQVYFGLFFLQYDLPTKEENNIQKLMYNIFSDFLEFYKNKYISVEGNKNGKHKD